jgi:predicted dienelactone hydrolase
MRAAAVLLVALVLAACDDGPPPWEGLVATDAPGDFAVGHTRFTVLDEARARTLPVDVWYPVDPAEGQAGEPTIYSLLGPLGPESPVAREDAPVAAADDLALVVFSHGYGGIAVQSTTLMEALASHGFVVASPEHVGNSQASGGDDFDTAAGHRVPDVRAVIDAMLDRSADTADAFAGRLDGRVGVAGHSFGGMTAIGAAAGWAGAPADARVRAIVPISAVIDRTLQSDERTSDDAGFSADQLATVEIPVLLVGGTEDVDVPVENNRLAFDRLVHAPVVYRLDIVGANHNHFANVCAIGRYLLDDLGIPQDAWPGIGAEALIDPYESTCGPSAFPIDEATRLQNLYVVAFFRAHLRGEVELEAYLSPSFAATDGDVRLQAR